MTLVWTILHELEDRPSVIDLVYGMNNGMSAAATDDYLTWIVAKFITRHIDSVSVEP